jgi:DNA-binding transcriptional MerR regulator
VTGTESTCSIGDLAEATGLSTDAIRVWEKRYGRPKAIRLPSGHRRYREADVRWLRRVAEALARGHRPGKVVRLGEEALDALLASPAESPATGFAEKVLGLARESRAADLRRLLAGRARTEGPREFLATAGEILTAAGRAWADGQLGIRHEHLLSEMLEDVLRGLREEVPGRRGGEVVVLTTLPGERHALGLQLAALATKLTGADPRILGAETPIPEIAEAARETGASVVALSISLASGGPDTDRTLAELRDALSPGVRLLAGGRGARGVRRGPRGIVYPADLAEFEALLAKTRED